MSSAALFGALLVLAAATAANTDEIDELLDRAEAAVREGRLISPVSGSAMALYQRALDLEPGNADAELGLVTIAERYLEDAETRLERNDLIGAGAALSQARIAYPGYPGLAPVEQRLALLEGGRRIRETLDWRLVAEQSPHLRPTLVKLGRLAKAEDCRVTIDVSNDVEGRWVFHEMNSAPGDGRIRADVRIASPAAVEVQCFEAS